MAPTDKDGWVLSAQFLPLDFDLVLVGTDDGQQIAAWYGCGKWDGVRLKDYQTVIKWKQNIFPKE